MPLLHYSSKTPKPIYFVFPKYTRTIETGPQTYRASSKPLVPKNARAGSVTEYLTKKKESSFGISQLAQVICEQQYIYRQWSPPQEFTARAKLGRDMHRDFLQSPSTPGTKRDIPFAFPEEEAAHFFLNVPFTVRRLLKGKKTNEFTLIGHHFDRAFVGSIDSLEVEIKETSVTFKIHEVKTTLKEELGELSMGRALIQASLYVFFLQKMLGRDPYFNFEAYFLARGLDVKRSFTPQFANAFLQYQLLDMNPKGVLPTNLGDLVDQWRDWIDSLPRINIDEFVYITTLRMARVSHSSGFGSSPTAKVRPYRHDVDSALRIGRTVIDLLDGHKTPSGMPKESRAFCKACEFHMKCPFTPELWSKPVEPLNVPIRESLLERWRQRMPPILSPTPRVSTDLAATPVAKERPSAAESALARRKLEEALQAERRRRRPELSAAFEKLQHFHATHVLVTKQRSLLTEELAAMKEHNPGLSSIERRNRAKVEVARKTTEQRRAVEEAKKMVAVQVHAQRMAQRAMAKKKQGGVVPYIPSTRTTAGIALYRPSLSRARLKRRQEQGPSFSPQTIPHGGQPVPEDNTYSVARLQASLKVPKNWTYQFDTLPSLAERQAAMTEKETKETAMGLNAQATKFTDAELEDMAREARRAKRRKERDGKND